MHATDTPHPLPLEVTVDAIAAESVHKHKHAQILSSKLRRLPAECQLPLVSAGSTQYMGCKGTVEVV